MQIFKYGAVTAVLCAAFMVPYAHAETGSALMERLQSLLAQVEDLKEQLADLRGEVREEIKTGLKEGMSDEDIKEIQELLATDPTIYPERLVTGYFGPLTSAALQRFQRKFELETTGTLNDETRAYLEELLEERFGESIPPGLLTAPGIQKKVELRLKAGCDNSGPGTAPLCQKIKIKVGGDDSDDSDDDDKSNAEDAIADAEKAIDALEEALDDVDEDAEGHEEATDALETAAELLEKAEDAFDEENYETAEMKAENAEEAADEGLDALENDDEEDDE